MRKGDKVSIRRIVPADFEQVSAHHYTLSATEPLTDIERIKEVYTETGFWTDHSGTIAVIENKESRLVGTIIFYKPGWRIDGFELGYITHAEGDRGKGFMTEAVSLLTAQLFEERKDLNRLQIETHTGNPASWRIAEKCGYRRDGELRESDRVNGKLENKLIYSMLRSDYEKAGI